MAVHCLLVLFKSKTKDELLGKRFSPETKKKKNNLGIMMKKQNESQYFKSTENEMDAGKGERVSQSSLLTNWSIQKPM